MPRTYRTPTPREKAKLNKSRQMMERGIQGEGDFLSKISTTMAKAARDDQKMAKEMYYSVPDEAREGEAYQYAGYREGGEVMNSSRPRASRYEQEKAEQLISEKPNKIKYDLEEEREKLIVKNQDNPRPSEYDQKRMEDLLQGYKAGGIVDVRGQGAARKTKGCKIT